MAKLLYFDLETCGLIPGTHCPHQIAMIIEIDGVEKERIELKMRPNPGSPVSPEALAVGHVTIQQLREYPLSQHDGYLHLCAVLGQYVSKFDKSDKFHLVGYNNRSFDDQFLRALWTGCNDVYFGSWFWADSIDCLVLASNDIANKKTPAGSPVRSTLPNFKLSTVAAYYGVSIDESRLHDALYDVEITREIYNRINYQFDANDIKEAKRDAAQTVSDIDEEGF